MKLIFFKKILKGLIAGALVSVLLLLCFSFILSKQDDPSKYLSLLSVIALCVGAFAAGKVSTLNCDSKALQGLACGLAFAVIVLLFSVLLTDFDGSSVIKILLTVLLAFIGAIIGRRREHSDSSRKRRRNVMKRYGAR